MWCELIQPAPKYYNLPVPISPSKLFSFIHSDQSPPSLILLCGSVGPRKGLRLLTAALRKSNLASKINVYVVGDVANSGLYIDSVNHISQDHSSYFYYLGYSDTFSLSVNINKTAFVFPSYSENQSRAQIESLKYNFPIFINAKSVSSELFSQYSDRFKLFNSSDSLSSLISSLYNPFIDSGISFSQPRKTTFTDNLDDYQSRLNYLLSLHS